MERWLAPITAQRIRGGVFNHIDDFIAVVDKLVFSNNLNPMLFAWTANPEPTLDRVGKN